MKTDTAWLRDSLEAAAENIAAARASQMRDAESEIEAATEYLDSVENNIQELQEAISERDETIATLEADLADVIRNDPR